MTPFDLGKALTKHADQPEKEPESHALRNTLMAGAAASPFAGLIGQKPLIHDPHLNANVPRAKSYQEISRMAQPGDVLMTGKPGGSFWKSVIKPLSGSEFYHAQPVVGRRGQHGTTVSAGQFTDPSFDGWSQKSILDADAKTVSQLMKSEYPDVTLLRPKKSMTAEQIKKFQTNAFRRSRQGYDNVAAVRSWAKDMFVPKLKMFEDKKGPGACVGDICSTLPAKAYAAAGQNVIHGKSTADAFPSDFLRSEHLEPVAAHVQGDYKMSPGMRRAMPYMTRGAMGLGLAGATYAASRDPALASVPLGLMAGNSLANRLAPHLKGETPPWLTLGAQLWDTKGKARNKLLKGFLERRLPLTLAGAGASYLGTRAIQSLLSRKPPEGTPDSSTSGT
jgi:hypothetical protein